MNGASRTLPDPLRASVSQYYARKLEEFGPTPRGVDWNSDESQRRRFAELLRIADGAPPVSLIDYGCGYGALLDYLCEQGQRVRYTGYDIAPEMVACAAERHARIADADFTAELPVMPADYVLSSGIFNVRLHHGLDEWTDYVLTTIDTFDALSRRGFAFNVLSTYSDPARRRDDLYYADPAAMFEHCMRKFGRVAVLHDYPLFEFTILVRKQG